MIITEQKQFEEIVRIVGKHQRLFLMGCGICAKTWATGGEKEVKEMAAKLAERGYVCTGGIETKEAMCDERTTRRVLRQNAEAIGQADAILVLACGAGTQTVAGLTELPTYPALNTLALSRVVTLSLSTERCRLCGECILFETGGVCPVTLCPKGLMNGPCGGYRDGKCEVDREKDCAWVQIYQRLSKFGEMEQYMEIHPPKDWSKMKHPRTVDKKAVA